MGDRKTYRLYRSDPEALEEGIRQASVEVGAELILNAPSIGDSDLRISHGTHCVALWLPYQGDDFSFFKALGTIVGCPWMELRIQEGNHWDYSLYDGGNHVDQFSAYPGYFDEDKRKVKGNPKMLSELWQIDLSRVLRYLVHWNKKLSGKAYPQDQFEYGNCFQIFDLLRALGGEEPIHSMHTLRLKGTNQTR